MSRIPGPGELIGGKYRLEEELGRGGMGSVCAARHVGTGRRFAVKLLSPELAGDAEAEARFLREATLASAINHSAIVEVYDIGRHGEAPYMVMKLLEGETLGQRLKRGRLALDEALEIMLPALDGVAAAHAHGIVHRDLKPDNIMLARDGAGVHPKVLDFGISKLLGPDVQTRLTKTGISLGTPLYMSPEQVRGEADIDARTDVYSLGVILYQMVTGELPFDGNNYADLVLKIVMGDALRPRARDAALPATLDAIIMRAMAVAPSARYPSIAALAADLQKLKRRSGHPIDARISKADDPTASTPFARADMPSYRPPARRAPLFLALGLLGAFVLGALAWLLWPAAPEPEPPAASAAPPDVAAAQPAPAAPALPPAAVVQPVQPHPPAAVEKAAAATATAAPPPTAALPSGNSASAAHATRDDVEHPGAKAKKTMAEDTPEAPKHKRIPSEIIDPFEDPSH